MKPFDSIRHALPSAPGLLLLVCALGIAALVCDCRPNSAHSARFNLHAAFGALLWLLAVSQFRRHAHAARPSRQPSRAVYLVLYVVFGAQQLIRAGVLLWNSAGVGSSHPAAMPAPENLRDFLAYGIVALLTIRVLAALRAAAFKRAGVTLPFPDLQHHK